MDSHDLPLLYEPYGDTLEDQLIAMEAEDDDQYWADLAEICFGGTDSPDFHVLDTCEEWDLNNVNHLI